jgi:hypothetical protein
MIGQVYELGHPPSRVDVYMPDGTMMTLKGRIEVELRTEDMERKKLDHEKRDYRDEATVPTNRVVAVVRVVGPELDK